MKIFCQKVILPVLLFLSIIYIVKPVIASAKSPKMTPTATPAPSPTITRINPEQLLNYEYNKKYINNTLGLLSIMHLSTCIVIGEKCQPENTHASLSTPQDDSSLGPFYKDGLLGVANNLLASAYAYPPASLSYSYYQSFSQLFSAPQAHAASGGLGLTALSAFAFFWSLNRNITYCFIIICLSIIGLMTIFRHKIETNFVIQLDKVILRTVLVIVMITFSYAIAGLLIDLMYLLLLMIFSMAKQSNLAQAQNVESLFGHVTADEIFRYLTLQSDPNLLVQNFISLIPVDFRQVTEGFLGNILSLQLYPSVSSGLHDMATTIETSAGASLGISGSAEFDPGGAAASILSIPLSGLIGAALSGLLVRLILTVAVYFALLFLYFKILFILIGSYIEIVFSVILAPYLLIIDIFPGKNYTVSWLKRLVANIITFPLLAVFFIVGASVTQAITSSTNAFLPPPLSGISRSVLGTIVGIGILLAIPGMIDRFKRWILPEYTMVNFPTTPGAIMGTVASIIPFVPYLTGVFSGLSGSITGKKPPPSQPSTIPHMPQMPHSPQA